MAINYLTGIDLNQNELFHGVIENQPNNTAAGTGVEGQLYFDTTLDVLKVWAGGAWTEVGGGVTDLTASTGTFITFTAASAATGSVNLGTFNLSATGTPSSTTYLRGDNTWSPISGIYTWTVAGDTGSEAVASGTTVTFKGNTYLSTTYYSATDTVEFNHDNTTRTDTTSSASPAHGGTFTAVDSVTTNATGHVTAINVKTVTLPADDDTTYDLSGFGTTNGTAGIQLVGSDATTDQVDINGSGTTTVTHSANVITITSNDQYTGTVTSVGTGNSTFISGSGGPITSSGSLTYSLSATGTPSSSTYLRGDNTWATLPGNQTITLSGEVTGSGTTSIVTTVANNVLDINNFTAATIVTEAEGIANNDNDTTLPTSAAVKDYVDNAIVGGLVYQGGYNAATNTPDLDVSPSASIKKGWTYTVTADGSFFTEQVRVGDVLIAENDAPTTLAEWTTVQNNIDLASASQVGIGNVAAGTGIGVSYSSGTATVSNTGVTSLIAGEGIDVSAATGAVTVSGEDSSATNKGIVIVAGGTGISVSYASGTATVTNTNTNAANTYAATISGTATITHSLGTRDVIIQLYDTVTYETVYADVDRISTSQATITFAATPTNSIRVLVQKIG